MVYISGMMIYTDEGRFKGARADFVPWDINERGVWGGITGKKVWELEGERKKWNAREPS